MNYMLEKLLANLQVGVESISHWLIQITTLDFLQGLLISLLGAGLLYVILRLMLIGMRMLIHWLILIIKWVSILIAIFLAVQVLQALIQLKVVSCIISESSGCF